MIMTVFAGIAEFERVSSWNEPRPAARRRRSRRALRAAAEPECRAGQAGAPAGRGGEAAREIADTFNVHVATIYRLAAAAS